MTMIFPTVRTMVALTHFAVAAEALGHAAAQSRVDAVLPMLRDEGGGLRLVLPGDPEGTGGVYDAMTGAPAVRTTFPPNQAPHRTDPARTIRQQRCGR